MSQNDAAFAQAAFQRERHVRVFVSSTFRDMEVVLCAQGFLLHQIGELQEALGRYEKHVQLCREQGKKGALQKTLNDQGLILRELGDSTKAFALHQESEQLCRELGDEDGIQQALGHRAELLMDAKDYAGAAQLFEQQAHICRELGQANQLAVALAARGLVLSQIGRINEALASLEAAHKTAMEHGLTALAHKFEPTLARIRAAAR